MLDTFSGDLYVAPSVALMKPLTGQAHHPAEDTEVINEEYLYTSVWRFTRLTKAGPTEIVRLDYMWSIWAILSSLNPWILP